ncbi:uncharacterized protein DUF4194 [Sphaerotilus hippei]|uniref:Uncharacterized protein DUF4194 n=1 Tax=Sphaerotilus hippei TaxID=744406 RepID=A0A318GYA2_9BURK|nr:DUF4194 domain-containing protein [Sphaerotilus hippei]PXW94944.1 uncharacterized protein DUF4194 [Sphaerotilus hippei]
MNYSSEPVAEDHVDQAESAPSSDAAAAFAGDMGQLALETRRALVQLLLGPSVDGHRQSKLWLVLLRDEAILRSRLHDLFLDLVVDREQKVAFTRQVVADNIDAPVLLRRAALTFLESALVLFLRQRLTHADAQGERAVVSKTEVVEHLRVFERDKNVDHARFERQMENALEKAKKLSLLHKLRGGDERFEISPTLKLLFPAEEIQALAHSYTAIAQAGGQPSEGTLDAASTSASHEGLATSPGVDDGDEEVLE